MKSLQTIQKTFRVFMILSRIGMILSFAWAGTSLLGMVCGMVWYQGGYRDGRWPGIAVFSYRDRRPF